MTDTERSTLLARAYNMTYAENIRNKETYVPIFTPEELAKQPYLKVIRPIWGGVELHTPKVHKKKEEREIEIQEAEAAITFNKPQSSEDHKNNAAELKDFETLSGFDISEAEIEAAIKIVLAVASEQYHGVRYPTNREYTHTVAIIAIKIRQLLNPTFTQTRKRASTNNLLHRWVSEHLDITHINRGFTKPKDITGVTKILDYGYTKESKEEKKRLKEVFKVYNFPTRKLVLTMAQVAHLIARDLLKEKLKIIGGRRELQLDSKEILVLSRATLALIEQFHNEELKY